MAPHGFEGGARTKNENCNTNASNNDKGKKKM
jgi:hypothetical protein